MKSDTSPVGQRIESEGYIGTVRYVGEIPSTKGTWFGVEWDDPNRGKHDGSHENVRYFTTEHPTSGSFIRPKKAYFGTDMVTAIKERYGRVEDDNAGVDVAEMFVVGEKNQHTTVEVVGAKSVNLKQSQFDHLVEVSLRDSGVCGGGPDGFLGQMLPQVRELDLSKNLIASWEEIARIVQQLPRLMSINVSENKLAFPEDTTDDKCSLQSIKVLYLNRMNYTWLEVLKCTDMAQHLQKLHMCFNHISAIPNIGAHLESINLINLESNPLSGWDEVLRFAKLPLLETLILNDTGIDCLEIPDVPRGSKSNFFPKLVSLSISDNKITKWSDISELDKLRSLTELYFKRNPAHDEYPDGVVSRTIVVAKIQQLKYYNRSAVSPIERKGAEVDYLKQFCREWRTSGGHQNPSINNPSADFKNAHPRYQTFIDKYGAIDDVEMLQQSTALKNSLVTVKIISEKFPEKPPLTKKLPLMMTVQKLKLLVQRLYRVNPRSMALRYSSCRMPGPLIDMESDQKEIGFYAVEEGDTIHVDWD